MYSIPPLLPPFSVKINPSIGTRIISKTLVNHMNNQKKPIRKLAYLCKGKHVYSYWVLVILTNLRFLIILFVDKHGVNDPKHSMRYGNECFFLSPSRGK